MEPKLFINFIDYYKDDVDGMLNAIKMVGFDGVNFSWEENNDNFKLAEKIKKHNLLIDYIHAKQREIKILADNHLKYVENPRIHFNEIKKHIDGFCRTEHEYYNRFIMMPGLRGVGKTTILYQLYEYITKEKGINESR